jgi:hypothetical protein
LLALSRLPAGLSAALATLLELWRATRALLPELLLLARQTLLALTTLLAGLATWAFWLSALTALWPARLAFILLFAFVLGIFTLCNDQTAIRSADALERDAQLWNRNRRHQGAGEQDVAKLLKLPDGFEWQGALLRILKGASIDARLPPRSVAPFRAPLRPDFGTQTQRVPMNSSSGLRGAPINQIGRDGAIRFHASIAVRQSS